MAVDCKINKAKQSGICGIQVSKVEQDIDDFLESFRRKSSTLDQPVSEEFMETLGLPTYTSNYSSSQCSTDECTDDSPERSLYLGAGSFPRKHMRQISNTTTTTSDSEWGPDYDEDCSKANIGHEKDNSLIVEALVDQAEESDVMGEMVCPYSVLDVAQLLQSRFAYVSGGKAKNGAPILTFPENPRHPDVSEEDYRKLITFLCCVPTLSEVEKGFVIVMDRRQAGWGDVKTLLLRIAEHFPNHIQVVYLLQPKSFFQRAFADMKSKFVKEELEFTVVLCNEPEEILDLVDASQLTSEVGGQLEFDANEWTQHKSAGEKFCSNAEQIATAVTMLLKKYDETEVPNDVAGMDKLIHDHLLGRKEILDDIASASTHGQTLLNCIMGDNTEVPLVHRIHVHNLERLIMKLEDTKKLFEAFWEKHEVRLKKVHQLRKFEDEFKLYQFSVQTKIETLESKMSELGESVQKVEALMEEFEEFEKEAERELDQAEKMRGNGEQMIAEDNYAVDSIRPKCIELQRMCDQYKSLLRRRRELLNKSHDLQDRIDKANKWCTKGVDMLSNMSPDQCASVDDSRKAVDDIENFMATSSQLRLNNPKEFRQLFESMITPETRVVVQKVLKKYEDVRVMCEKRKESFQRVMTNQRLAPPGPMRAVHPENVVDNADGDLKRKVSQEHPQRQPAIYEKSARLKPELSPQTRPRVSYPSASSVSNMSETGSEKTRSSLSSMSTSVSIGSSISDTDILHAKQRHVLNELIESEKTYVLQLSDILKGYFYRMDDRSMRNLIPVELYGKRDVLFGNLEQIYNFHNNIFLQELQNCQDAPAKVGKCFTNRKEEFHLYSVYCQNKMRSEALQNQVGDQNPFFMECQRRLGHKLPLGAYLLKPVQRITKYQLLLKEMLRFTDHDRDCESQLQEALDCMLEVVRYVNDSLHQISIVGFPGNLTDQGKLLMQGSFNISTEHKGKMKDLRFKPMQRHIFLYEKSILLCKRKEDTHNSEKGVYSFKKLLKLSQVGLTENAKSDKKKFELWLRNREEVYVIQAPSLPCKELWVKEIKRVLMEQFDLMKESRLSHRSTEDLQDLPGNSQNSNQHRYVDNWRTHNAMVFNNNTPMPTIPVGLEMMSPESPPQETPETTGWSTDEYSEEEDIKHQHHHQQHHSSSSSSERQYRSVSDFKASDPTEMNLKEGDIVKILRTGSNGWWHACHCRTYQEGWVPSTYLEPLMQSDSSHFSVSSAGSSSQEFTSKSSPTSVYSTTSPVDETTV